MFEQLQQAVGAIPRTEINPVMFGPFHGGLVTDVQPEQMELSQLSEAKNIILTGSGVARTRDGSTKVMTGMTGEAVSVGYKEVNGDWYTLGSDDDSKLYYSNTSGSATAIATLDGGAFFESYLGSLIIFDGGRVKRWDGTDVTLLYDNGTSSSAYQFTNRTGTADDAENVKLGHTGAGYTTSISFDFTTQDWSGNTAGTYTTSIPPTIVYADMYKVGSPTGSVEAQITTTASVECAAVNFSATIASLTTDTSGEEYEALFTASDITTELEPNTNYQLKLNYSGGDASNYVMVKHIDSSTPKASLKPGMPPKASFGIVENNILFAIEGTGGDNPSYLHHTAAGDYLDWSYLAVVDDDSNSYPIGSIASYYNDVWIYGSKKSPYFGKLNGSIGSFSVGKLLHNISGDYKSTVTTPDDLIFLHPTGIDGVRTIQEYGDVKSSSQADNIKKTIHDYFSTGAVAAYDPVWGLYVIKMEGTSDLYVVHTRMQSVRASGVAAKPYFPITKWTMAFSGDVTAMGTGNGVLMLGTDQGEVFQMDKTTTKDNNVAPTYIIKTAYPSTKFGEFQAIKIGFNAFGKTGGTCNFKFYKNFSRDSFYSVPFSLAVDSTLLTSEALMDTVDADFYLDPELNYYDRENINFNYRSLMVGIEDIVLLGQPLYFGRIDLLIKHIGGF